MRTICCVCQKVKIKNDWQASMSECIVSPTRLSHGFCPECYEKTLEQFQQHLDFRKKQARMG